MDYLYQRKTELENEINSFEFPLFYSQVLKRDRLIKELNKVRGEIMKKQVIYYNEKGQIDKFATYINNHDWCLPVWFVISIIVMGLVEGM
jgi:hypothetical protein